MFWSTPAGKALAKRADKLTVLAHLPNEGSEAWSEERVVEIMGRYERRVDFKNENRGAYWWVHRNRPDLLEKFYGEKPRTDWDDLSALQERVKYPSKEQFRKGCRAAYNHLKRRGLLV